MSEYIKHHGIKGQKWGVRRFQNSDGSLTDAGRKRYNSDYDGGKDTAYRKTVRVPKGGTSSDDYKKALDATKTVSEGVEQVRKFKSSSDKLKDRKVEKEIRKNVSQMTDKELQQAVQRLNMEENYTRMMLNRDQVNRGQSYVNTIMDVSAVALKGATTALTIALLIKQLQGK